MDISRLNLSISNVHIGTDGSTHLYDIQVVYGKLLWTVSHRFSDFHALFDALRQEGYEGLPLPPAKTLTRPCDPNVLEGRRIMLQNWTWALCSRPDLRTSPPFLEFLEFEIQTSTVVPSLAPALIGYCASSRFHVSDCVYIPQRKSLIVSYEEAANISRLGKVWSLVEQDELGAIDIWNLTSLHAPAFHQQTNYGGTVPVEEEALFVRMAHTVCPYRMRGVVYHPETGRIFAGTDNGLIKVYTIAHVSREDSSAATPGSPLELIPDAELALHSEAVLCLRGDASGFGRVLSVGFDGAIRLINCTTLETICGGRFTKRFAQGEHLSATAALEPAMDEGGCLSSKIIVGTDRGQVFVCSSKTNPPQFIGSLQFDNAITALELAGSNLLIAHKYGLSIYRLTNSSTKQDNNGRTGSNFAQCIMVLKVPLELTTGRTIRAIALSKLTPLLFLGHSKVISIWNCISQSCVTMVKCHGMPICRMHVIEEGRHLTLLTAGADGLIKAWSVTSHEDYELWINRQAMETNEPNNKNHQEHDTCCHTTIQRHPQEQTSKQETADNIGYKQKHNNNTEDDDEEEDTFLFSGDIAMPHRH